MNRRIQIPAYAVLAAALTLTAGCTAPEDMRPLAVGDEAPAYTARAVTGDSISIREHDGAVLLNVWATWCVPCREEMPALDSLHRAYRERGLRVVGANIDSGDAMNAVRNFATDYDLSFDLLLDPQQRVVRTFRTAGVPESFLIDRHGRIAARWIGKFDPLADQVVTAVEAALGTGED